MELRTKNDDWPTSALAMSSLQVYEQLGRGGFASCWRAAYNGTQVALKVMTPRPKLPAPPTATAAADCSLDEEEADLYERMFLREAQVTSQLEHRCAATILCRVQLAQC